MSDPKKESEKPAIKDLKENKLSNEEINRMSRRAETENLSGSNLLNKDESDSKNNLKPPTQVYVENNHHHHGYYYGGGAVILLVILIIVLV
jgi:cytochrome oxidase assembly protein ShyY1